MLGNAPFGLYCGKWDYRKMMENSEWYAAVLASDQKVCSGINVVKMRYPQVLLMYAEVVNELYGKGATAEGCTLTATAALKEVHDRAFTDATKRDAAWTALMGKDFFDAIVDENAWELAGEGVRKFDLIRWNLLSEKIDEFKNEYTNAVYNGTYPQYVNYKYRTDNPMYIDMTSLVFGAKVGGEYENKSFFGAETSDKEQKNLKVNLPSISGGLNKAVKNRYLLPIASTTISTSNGKLHVVSIAGLIGADYRLPSIDYTHIFQVCAALTHSVAEMWKVYRLMVFNYVIDNKDDHAKNFAFIYRDGDWHFAPAYDLLPSDGINGFHTTSINDSIEPTKEDLFAVAVKAGLNEKEVIEVFEKMVKYIGAYFV